MLVKVWSTWNSSRFMVGMRINTNFIEIIMNQEPKNIYTF